MKRRFLPPRNIFFGVCIFICLSVGHADTDETVNSFHLGMLHPNGVDVIGYSSEKKLSNGYYSFYTFGFPSIAAIGISYHDNYPGSGLTATLGVGIGSVMYASLAYQWQTGKMDYLKLGGGFTTGIAYTGSYPVISYEHRY